MKCVTEVKYLGMRVNIHRNAQLVVAKQQITRNLNHLRWKVRGVDHDVMEQLVCCLARSILIYIGTPMVAAGLWQRRDIDREETQLLRKVYNLPNNITSRAVNNILTQMRPAWSVVERLAAKTWRMFKKQNCVTEYYEKK